MPRAPSQSPSSTPARTSVARSGDEASAMTPGQPHLLARRIEADRERGQDPVARVRVGREPGTGAPRRRRRRRRCGARPRRPWGSGGARGEDDPRVVGGPRSPGRAHGRAAAVGLVALPTGEDAPHPGGGEYQVGTIRRVVRVDGDVGRAHGKGAEDGDVEVGRSGRHPDPDTVAAADTVCGEHRGHLVRLAPHRRIVEAAGAVVDRRPPGMGGGGGGEDVEQRARGSGAAPEMNRPRRRDVGAPWPLERRRRRDRDGASAGRTDSCWMHAESS